MSFLPGLMELIILLLVIGAIVAAAVRRRGSGNSSGSALLPRAAQGVMLQCPHCGQQTEARAHACRHCGEDL